MADDQPINPKDSFEVGVFELDLGRDQGEATPEQPRTPAEIEGSELSRMQAMEEKTNEFRQNIGIAFQGDESDQDLISTWQVDRLATYFVPLDENEFFQANLVNSTSGRLKRLKRVNDALNDPTLATHKPALMREKAALLVVQAYMDTALMHQLVNSRLVEMRNTYLQQQEQAKSNSNLKAQFLKQKEAMLTALDSLIKLSTTCELYFEKSIPAHLKYFEEMDEDDQKKGAREFLKHLNVELDKKIDSRLNELGPIEVDEPQHDKLKNVIVTFGLNGLNFSLNQIKIWLESLQPDQVPPPAPAQVKDALTNLSPDLGSSSDLESPAVDEVGMIPEN